MQSDVLHLRADDARATFRQLVQELADTRDRVHRSAVHYRRTRGFNRLCPSDRQYMDLRLVLDAKGGIIGPAAHNIALPISNSAGRPLDRAGDPSAVTLQPSATFGACSVAPGSRFVYIMAVA